MLFSLFDTNISNLHYIRSLNLPIDIAQHSILELFFLFLNVKVSEVYFVLSLLQLDLQYNRVKLILRAHDNIEYRYHDSKSRDNNRHDHCGVSVGYGTVDYEHEQEMDKHLRTVLSTNGPHTHSSSKWNWLLAHFSVVINAEGIEDCGYEHVFTNETDVAVTLYFRHGVVKSLL